MLVPSIFSDNFFDDSLNFHLQMTEQRKTQSVSCTDIMQQT